MLVHRHVLQSVHKMDPWTPKTPGSSSLLCWTVLGWVRLSMADRMEEKKFSVWVSRAPDCLSINNRESLKTGNKERECKKTQCEMMRWMMKFLFIMLHITDWRGDVVLMQLRRSCPVCRTQEVRGWWLLTSLWKLWDKEMRHLHRMCMKWGMTAFYKGFFPTEMNMTRDPTHTVRDICALHDPFYLLVVLCLIYLWTLVDMHCFPGWVTLSA